MSPFHAFILWIFHHVVSSFSFLLALVFASFLVRERRPPGSTLAWLLIILLIPYVGIPLYFLIGGRKIVRIAATKKALYLPVQFSKTDRKMSVLERLLCSSGAPR